MVRFLPALTWHRRKKSKTPTRVSRPRRPWFAVNPLESREVPATFVVTNLNDGQVANPGDQPGTLRQAIFDANALPGADIIDLTGVNGTIGLTEGELTVTSNLTFNGPGPSKLAISGNKLSRVFQISDNNASVLNVTMSGLTITGGALEFGYGAGMQVGNENLTLNNMVVRDNHQIGDFGHGGGIAIGSDGGATLTMNNTTIADNSTHIGNGGGIYFYFPFPGGNVLSINNSTVSGNVAGLRGGGIYFVGYAAGGTASFSMRNSTVSSNIAQDEFGGGIVISATNSLPMSIYNSTITGNRALATPGGGGLALNYGNGVMEIESSIIAGNSGPTSAPEIYTNSSNKINSKNNILGSLVGIADVGTNYTNLGGTIIGSALLGPLANNGGPTKTHMPLQGSPAINAGSNPTPAVANDQRGAGHPRQIGSGVDIGAVEVDPTLPYAHAITTNVTSSGGVSYSFKVTYTDDVAIKVNTLGNGDVRVVGPNGFDEPATFVSVDNNGNGTPRVATYSITPPMGSWDYTDNGAYSVVLQAGQVTDTSGVDIATDVIGNFRVAIGRNLIVTTVSDSGPGSLRDAIDQANLNTDVTDTITFDTVQMGSSTIALSMTGALVVTDPVIIKTATPITLDALQMSRIMVVDGPGQIAVNIEGMVFTNGLFDSGGPGGALVFANENLTLTNCQFINNSTGDGNAFPGGGGGAIGGVGFGGGALTIIGCVFDGNVAGGGNVFNRGGAIYTGSFGTIYDVVIRDSTFINNKTYVGDGGALAFGSGSLLIENSTFANNFSSVRGGAIAGGGAMNAGGFNIVNSTISGNKSGSAGGGVFLDFLDTTANFLNTTITENTCLDISGQFSGGGIARSQFVDGLQLTNTVVARNFNVAKSDIASEGDVLANNSLIGNASGLTIVGSGNITGTKQTPVNPFLAPLANNGGPTLTHLPYSGSPLIDAGPATSTLTFDQRGAGHPRVLNGKVDIGAFEADPNIPSATTTLNNVTTAGGTVYTITVIYADNVAINVSTLDNNDIRIVGPNGFNVLATFKGVTPGGNGTPRTATYEFTPPGGAWDGGDDGLYTVSIEPSQVADTSGNFVQAHVLGTFRCAIPLNLVVTNADDSGPGSLRDAIALANNNFDVVDTITFDAGYFSTPRTIVLTTGELLIADTVIINNSAGAKYVTLEGVNSRIFTIDTPDSGEAVSISGLTMTKGTGQGTGQYGNAVSGGAIMNQDEALTVAGCVFVNNSASDDSNFFSPYGGAIYLANTAASLSISSSTITGNFALNGGGGIGVFYDSVVSVTNCTISGNSTGNNGGVGGGIMFNNGGTLTIDSSTIANNVSTATGSSGGGGISLSGYGSGPATATITNSTITGNSAIGSGGGIRVGGFDLTVRNSTIAQNAARSQGGGIFFRGYGATVTLTSTIVASNKNIYTPDLAGDQSNPTFSVDNSLIGVVDTATIAGANNKTGTLAAPLNPVLGPLTNNGGLTQTMMPLPGSPAINNGSNPAGLTTDQRGAGFARTQGSATDIGATESNPAIPTASGSFAPVTTTGGTNYSFDITYTDDTAINIGTLSNNNVRVTGPGGFNVLATFVNVTPAGNGSPRTATYQFTPPGGSWTPDDNGVYSISIEPNQVADTGGAFVPAALVNTLFVGIARTFVVTNTQDSGTGSLRDAIANANANSGVSDFITFDPTVFGSAQSILLGGTELRITDPVTITGPGVGSVTVSGNDQSRVFSIDLPAAYWGEKVALSHMTIAKGNTQDGHGAGILNESASLVIDSCVITECFNFNAGGAIATESIYAPVTIINSTITGNEAYQGAAVYINGGIPNVPSSNVVTVQNSTISSNKSGGNGAGIYVQSGGAAVIQDSTLKSNVSDSSGGGVFVTDGGTLTVSGSTLSGNESKYSFGGGGGIFLTGNSNATISNSTISGNSAFNGAGITANYFDGTFTVRNTTVAFNTAVDDGGGIGFFSGSGTINLTSTIVANNNAGNAPDLFSGSATQSFTTDYSLIGKSDGSTLTGSNNKIGTIASPIDPMLDLSLTNNGGPTETHKLLSGSPAINTGSNPAGLVYDQRGPTFARTSGAGTDIGAFEIQGPPTAMIQVNDGGLQRSMVTSFKVTFSAPVTFPDGIAAAFQLTRTGPGAPTGAVTLAFAQSGNDVTITFNDPVFAPQIGLYNSLIDGSYTLTLVANKIQGGSGFLDGDGDGVGGDNKTVNTHRLFGDADGSGTVTAADFNAFRLAYGSTGPSIFDYNGDNQISATDFNQFRTRYGVTIMP